MQFPSEAQKPQLAPGTERKVNYYQEDFIGCITKHPMPGNTKIFYYYYYLLQQDQKFITCRYACTFK